MSDAAPPIDVKETHQVAEFKHGSPLLACRFDPSGQFVFASAFDATIQRWNLATGKATPLLGHESWVYTLAMHPSGSTLYSGGYEGRVIWWDVTAEEPKPLRTIEAHRGWVRAVAVSPDGNLLATCGNDNLVHLWNSADGTHVQSFVGHANHVYNVAFHPTRPAIVSGDLKGAVREWDIASGEQLRQFDASPLWKYDEGFGADIGGVRSIAFSADGKYLACGGITEVSNAFAGIGTPIVLLFDYDKGEKAQQWMASKKFRGVVTGLRFHPDGFVVGSSSGHDGGHLLFWKIAEPNEYFDCKLPDSARDLDMHRDQKRLVTSDPGGSVRVWQMEKKSG